MAAPYNPLASPLASKAAIIARARARAHADTLAKMAALPSDETLRAANTSLLSSIGGQLADFRGLASNIGGSYGAAVAPAAAADASTAAQVGAVGAQPVADTRGGLLGAMAGSTYGSLLGRQGAAQAGGAATVTANAAKRGAVGAGEGALFEQYLQAGYDDALKTSVAQSNDAIASAGVGIDQQNADAHTLSSQASASRAATAAQRAADLNAKQPVDAALKRARSDAAKAISKILHGSGSTKTSPGATYRYEIPGVASDTTGKTGAPYVIEVTAKNGTDAITQFNAKVKALRDAGMLANYNFQPGHDALYFRSSKPLAGVATANAPGTRSAALHEAARIILAAGLASGMTREQALAEARIILGPAPAKKKANTSGQKASNSIESRR